MSFIQRTTNMFHYDDYKEISKRKAFWIRFFIILFAAIGFTLAAGLAVHNANNENSIMVDTTKYSITPKGK